MKCVIISEKKVIDLGKRCLSNLRDFVNDEYLLGFNEVKRLRTLFFLACQKVVGEQLKSKNHYSVLEKLYSILEKLYLVNEVYYKEWNERLEKKFKEALMITKKSKVGNDESEVEEVFKTPVCDKYSRMKFSLEEIYKIIDLVEEGINKCLEINDYVYFKIKDFKNIYYVYNINYNYIF